MPSTNTSEVVERLARESERQRVRLELQRLAHELERQRLEARIA